MRRYTAERDCLTVYRLPLYAQTSTRSKASGRDTAAHRAFADPLEPITTALRDLRQIQFSAIWAIGLDCLTTIRTVSLESKLLSRLWGAYLFAMSDH